MNTAKQQAAKLLRKHEGFRLKPYRCTAGKLTIGYGRNLDDKGINKAEAEAMLKRDINSVDDEMNRQFNWYRALDDARKTIIIDMGYNLGLERFKGFKRMITAIETQDYNEAAVQMLDSKWAAQVGQRAHYLAQSMKRGFL